MGRTPTKTEIPRDQGFGRAQELLLAVACGLAVANVYFIQPLLDTIAVQFRMSIAAVGAIPTLAQIGYALGLLLIVPLGDVLDRQKLIVVQSLLSAAALTAVACSWSAAALLASSAAVGALAVVTQVMVAHVAAAAGPARRGGAVGLVTSGVIIGILAARTASGAMADLFGWRSVYLAAALATSAIALLLHRMLPSAKAEGEHVPYPRLIASTLSLLATDRALRHRAGLAFFIFAGASTLLTAMVLPLTAAPFLLTHTEVGLFGLAGAAGALGSARAGAWSDRGHARLVTGLGLGLMLLAWGLAAMLEHSLWWLAAAMVVLDFGLQSTHVANQFLIYRSGRGSQSRLTAAYMIFYSLGSALGSIVCTAVYARGGWTWVCAVGFAFAVLALLWWAAAERPWLRADDHLSHPILSDPPATLSS